MAAAGGPLGPGDLGMVYGCLTAALNADPATRQPAEAALQELEARGGFCSCLLEVIANRTGEVQHEARWVATVYFKNCINRCWRVKRDGSHWVKCAPPAVSAANGVRSALYNALNRGVTAEEKLHLRAKLLELVREDSPQVAIQLALIVAKVARTDYPRDWPGLFPGLLGQLTTADGLATQRIYLTLHHLLKELASKRLAADQKNFAEITQQLFEHVWGQWGADTQLLVASFAAGGAATEDAAFKVACQRWRFCLKALRRLLCFGHAGDARTLQDVPAVVTVMPALLSTLIALLPYWPHVKHESHPLHSTIVKGILKLIKTAIEVQTSHPWSCRHAHVLPPWLEFCFAQICAPLPSAVDRFTPLLIQAMMMIQNALKFSQANDTALSSGGAVLGLVGATPGAAERLQSLRHEVRALLTAFFSPERVFKLSETLVGAYLPLSDDDLREWEADPEAYYHLQATLSFRDSLRPCAETLLLVAMQSHRALLAPHMLHWLTSLRAQPPTCTAQLGAAAVAGAAPPPEVRTKEAMYNTFGLGAYELHDHVDFERWFESHLVLELADRHPAGRTVRRRAAWMVGCWVAKVGDTLRPTAYRLLIMLMDEPDACVQLAAVDALRALVEDWGFYEGPFLEFAAPCFQRLFALLKVFEELDSQLQVFNLVYTLVERLGAQVRPFAGSILEVLPALWEQGDSQSLLRVQLVQTLQKLVTALGTDCGVAAPILLPLLGYCTDPEQPEALNLLEDGLSLWYEALQQMPALDPTLLALFPNIVRVCALSTEHVQVALGVLENYLLLAGRELLEAHASKVVEMLTSLLDALNERGTLLVFPVLDTMLQLFPQEAPTLLEPPLLRTLGLVLGGKHSDMVVASAACVLARVLLQNNAAFGQMMASAAAMPELAAASGAEGVLDRFLDAWLDKSDALCTPKARKVTALALCTLLSMGAPQVLQRLDLVASLCTSVVYEADDEEADGASVPSPGWAAHLATAGSRPSALSSSVDTDAPEGSGKDRRRQQLERADPVNVLVLRTVLAESMAQGPAVYGAAPFQAAVKSLDATILKHLQECTQPVATSSST